MLVAEIFHLYRETEIKITIKLIINFDKKTYLQLGLISIFQVQLDLTKVYLKILTKIPIKIFIEIFIEIFIKKLTLK